MSAERIPPSWFEESAVKSMFLPALLLAWSFAPSAHAQCTGTGASLSIPNTVAIGESVTVQMHADLPVTTILLFISLGDGPVNGGSYGTLCVDFPPAASMLFVLDPNGDASFSEEVPCDPSFLNQTFYSQFITCSPGGGRGSHGASNMVDTTIVDGLGSDSFCTYTQESWGDDCATSSIACMLEQEFDNLFPNGFLIGDSDGPFDGDTLFAARFDSAAALKAFLPIYFNPAALDADVVDPLSVIACGFAGELVAAKLNVAFDDAALFDPFKCRTDLKLGDLLLVQKVHKSLLQWTVRDLIDLCDLAISGAFPSGLIDVDGDGTLDLSIADLSNALNSVNRNFEGCASNLGYLGIP